MRQNCELIFTELPEGGQVIAKKRCRNLQMVIPKSVVVFDYMLNDARQRD